MNNPKLSQLIVNKTDKLSFAMERIDTNSNGVAFVVDDEKVLCGALSDGDIRRWILKGGAIDAEVVNVMKAAPYYVYEQDRDEATALMHAKSVTAIPIVDDARHIIDICTAKDVNYNHPKKKDVLESTPVVIMAGGKGTRLYPYTKILPKPLIPIGDIPIIERVMDTFYGYGVRTFYMSVNYKKNMIQSYFADANKEYHIKYIEENKPLGTAGSLRLIEEQFTDPIIVANCDSLIKADYNNLYEHHINENNDITMVVSVKNDRIPYGVVKSNDKGELEEIIEKPTNSYMINTGMYVINPDMIKYIPNDEMYHMTELINAARDNGCKVGIYPVSEDSFLDMGEMAEMQRMEEKLGIK